ncbi:hypothetical protein ACFY2R_28265 [Micromonospora olivasterospora]|uniref:hypothetical protein n=1 Tax=Micromonospora olivasterospora TaxID=1880 RepID=UPI0031DB2204
MITNKQTALVSVRTPWATFTSARRLSDKPNRRWALKDLAAKMEWSRSRLSHHAAPHAGPGTHRQGARSAGGAGLHPAPDRRRLQDSKAVVTADPARVAAARQLLAHLGVTLADLQADPLARTCRPSPSSCPTSSRRPGRGGRRTYGTSWNRMAAAWGERPLDAIAASDIEAMQRQIAATARSRRNSRSGRHAGEHVIAAARAIYNRAIADGLIDAAASPPTGWSSPAGYRAPVAPSPPTSPNRSTSLPAPAARTSSSTRC